MPANALLTNTGFDHVVELSLPEFPYDPPPYGGLAFRCPTAVSLEQRYETFAREVLDAVGQRYLPIYRMADGEFVFLVGRQAPLAAPRNLRGWLSARTAFLRPQARRTYWGEGYQGRTRSAALLRLQEAVRTVTHAGYIAPYFALRPDRWSEEYHEPVLQWFAARRIALHDGNTIPFYLVYALLNGRYRTSLFEGRSVLVVTSLTDPARRAGIEAGLRAEGVARLQFLPVSAHAAMLDRIDVSQVEGKVDLALVAAGIGSVNVLAQLQPLNIPAIDCGIALECYLDPQRRWERPFLIDASRVGPDELGRQRQF